MARIQPSFDLELQLRARGATLVGGMDEVGRGALAGPVTVGIVVIDPASATAIPGLADSKLLSPRRRETLAPVIREWAVSHAIGNASAEEIDRSGIMFALRLAAERAYAGLKARPDVLILDGADNWCAGGTIGSPIETLVKADQKCSSVAAASVLAKVSRDDVMTRLGAGYLDYGWERNKGYGTAQHRAAIDRCGVTGYHRKTWTVKASSADGE